MSDLPPGTSTGVPAAALRPSIGDNPAGDPSGEDATMGVGRMSASITTDVGDTCVQPVVQFPPYQLNRQTSIHDASPLVLNKTKQFIAVISTILRLLIGSIARQYGFSSTDLQKLDSASDATGMQTFRIPWFL